MKFTTFGIILLVHIYSYSIADAAGYNEACTEDANCIDTGQMCSTTSGTCVCEINNDYSYDGNKCVKDIDECESQPCLNGGVCSNLVNAYSCSCDNGYTGGNCQVAPLGASCSTSGTSCADNNAICQDNGQGGKTCHCRSTHYDNNGSDNFSGTCMQKVELGSSGCSTAVSDSCKSPNARCQSNGYCTCNTGYYDSNGGITGGTCTKKVELGSSGCSTAVSDSCRSPNAQCQSNRYCTCYTGYYDSNGGITGGTCTQKVELGSFGCSTAVSDSCKSPNAQCQSNGYCTCNSGYYDSNGGITGGSCTKKVQLGSTGCSKSVTDSCKDNNAECLSSGGTCTCKYGYYDDNGSSQGGTCKKEIGLGEPGCSTSVSDSCKDVKSRCNGTGGYCTCMSGYYDSNGAAAGGTCETDKALGKACTGQQNECADSAAECWDGKCTCGINYYDSNGFTEGGNCASISELKVLAINFPADSVETSGFKVTWSPPSADKASKISEYGIEWTLKTQDNSLGGGGKVVSNTSIFLVIASGVSPGKTYNVKVISKNLVTQTNVPRTTFLSKEQAAKPDIPRLLTTPDLIATDRTIRVGWSAPATGVASGYRIKLLDGTTQIAETETQSSTVSLTSSEMKNGYNYNVEITARSEAYDGSNYVWSEKYVKQIKTVVQVPSAPRSVTCATIKDESITLTWTTPEFPNGDLVRYYVQVLSVSMQPLFNSSTSQPVESHTVTSLSPGTTYKFRVFTVNEMYTSVIYGESNYCMTKAKFSDAPRNLVITNTTSRSFIILWDTPENINAAEIYGFVLQIKIEDDTCVTEIIYRCSDCTGGFFDFSVKWFVQSCSSRRGCQNEARIRQPVDIQCKS